MDAHKGVLGLDIETSSALDITNGAWAYSLHETTRVYCAVLIYAETIDGPRTRFDWLPGVELPSTIVEFIRAGGSVVAHNVGFEFSICRNILTPVYGWPEIADDQWRDTQVHGLAVNLPAKLEGLAQALGCPVQKNTEGAKLMRNMATPKKDKEGNWIYDEDPEHLLELLDYCGDDVEATLDSWFRLPALSVAEQLVHRADHAINARGVYLDQAFAAKCLDVSQTRSKELAGDAFVGSKFGILDPKATPELKRWLTDLGVEMPMVKKKSKKTGKYEKVPTCDRNAVLKMLDKPDLPVEARIVLTHRLEANKATSLSKLNRVPTMVGPDGRLRFALQYCGAHTGRWTSSGLQIHNLPKDKMEGGESILVRRALEDQDVDMLKLVSPRPLEAISQSLRSVISAPPGYDLIAADYSAIEAVVLAWLAEQEDILQLFRRREDVYVYTAKSIGSTNRALGKVAQLALGYGMGPLKFSTTAAQWGVPLELKEAKRVHTAWRAKNAKIRQYWLDVERAARKSVEQPGRTFEAGAIRARTSNGCLSLVLPSGRPIRYWHPRIKLVMKKFEVVDDEGNVSVNEREMEELQFFTQSPAKDGMVIESTYGGKLVENITQGTARDLLGSALDRIERVDPYRIVMHVHDSIASEVPEGTGSVNEFSELMRATPTWGAGMPVNADGYRDKHFRG